MSRSSSGTRVDADTIRPPHIDGYDDLVVIGRGASSTVYRARQASHGRDVAIKVLTVDISDRKARRRFDRERSVNGRLSDHPNVVTVLESGLVEGRQPYLAMELFEHGSLADRLARRGPFELGETLHHGIRVAGALESAHRLGVLHRDIKPHNILLSRFGEPALADFGIASLLENERAMTAALTPNHAAPELLEGEDPTAQSDVYSLGSTLYTLLAGTPPFAGPDGEGVLAQLLRITTSDMPPMPRTDVPPTLAELLRTALARSPGDRPASAADFGRALQGVQTNLGLAATPLPLGDADGAMPASPAPAAPPLPPPAAVPHSDAPPPPHTPVADAPAGDAGRPAAAMEHDGDETIDVPTGLVPGGTPRPQTSPGWDDETVDPDQAVSSPTVVGRAASVRRRRAEPTSRRRLPIVMWSVVAVLVGAGIILGASRLLGRDDDSDAAAVASDSEPGADAGESGGDQRVGQDPAVAPDDVAALAPVDVTAIASAGGGLLVTWDDQADGRYQFVVVARLADGTDVAADDPTEPGAETATVDVSADRVECVTVMAILGRRDGELVRAESEPFCF